MSGYKRATICLNGHVISKYDANSQKFCSKCGKETFSTCTECGSSIRGKYVTDGIVDLTGYYDKPYYCYNCGKPYPWTNEIINNAIEILSLDGEINQETKDLIKSALPDLIVETPKTSVAIAKYSSATKKVGEIVAQSLRQLLVDVISETAKRALFS